MQLSAVSLNNVVQANGVQEEGDPIDDSRGIHEKRGEEGEEDGTGSRVDDPARSRSAVCHLD